MPALGPTLAKPARRLAGSGIAAPEEAHYWRGLTFLAPMWSAAAGSGPAADIAGRQLSNGNLGSFGAGRLGLGWVTAAASKYIKWPSQRGYNIDGDIAFSVFVAVDITGFNTLSAGIMALSTNVTADGYWRLVRTGGANPLQFGWRAGGTNQSVTFATGFSGLSNAGLGYHTFVLTRRPGGRYELFTDGLSTGTQTNVNAPVAGTHELYLGNAGGTNLANNMLGTFYLAAIWQGRALNVVHARQLHADPFRFLRSPDEARTVYDLSTGTRPRPGLSV